MKFAEFDDMTRQGTKLPLAAATGLLLAGCAHIHTIESTQHMSEDELADLCDALREVIDKKCTGLDPDARDDRGMSADAAMTQCLARRDNAQESYANVCMPPGHAPGRQRQRP